MAKEKAHKKETAIVTVIGEDKPGIVSAVTTALSKANVNIEDTMQTIMGNYFVMIMLIDITRSTKNIIELKAELDAVGKKTGQHVQIQHEKIFQAMHRI